jgi:hypothetical protein
MNDDKEHKHESMVAALARLGAKTIPDRTEPNRGASAAQPEQRDQDSGE